MCLGVPGKIESIEDSPVGMPMATVSFAGIRKQICLAYVPEARIGEYVLVHVGFALSVIDEQEAQQTFRYLEEMGELQELEVPQTLPPDVPEGREPGS